MWFDHNQPGCLVRCLASLQCSLFSTKQGLQQSDSTQLNKSCHRVEQKLVSALYADASEHARYLQSWTGIAKPVDTSELAPHLKKSLILPADWCQFASPNPHQAVESQAGLLTSAALSH
jgi:hypothetical protein